MLKGAKHLSLKDYSRPNVSVYKIVCIQDCLHTRLFAYKIVCIQDFLHTRLFAYNTFAYKIVCIQYFCIQVCLHTIFLHTRLFAYNIFAYKIVCIQYFCIQDGLHTKLFAYKIRETENIIFDLKCPVGRPEIVARPLGGTTPRGIGFSFQLAITTPRF